MENKGTNVNIRGAVIHHIVCSPGHHFRRLLQIYATSFIRNEKAYLINKCLYGRGAWMIVSMEFRWEVSFNKILSNLIYFLACIKVVTKSQGVIRPRFTITWPHTTYDIIYRTSIKFQFIISKAIPIGFIILRTDTLFCIYLQRSPRIYFGLPHNVQTPKRLLVSNWKNEGFFDLSCYCISWTQ